ncbi:MAG: sterol desaturase family protein [Qipengyuania sp.]
MEVLLLSARNAITAIVPMAGLFLLLALAVKGRGVRKAFTRSKRESLTNFGIWIVNYILLVPLLLLPVVALHAVLPKIGMLAQLWEAVWWPAAILVAILLIDFSAYWRHRLEHDPALWRIHATHHADEAMTWFSVNRKHPLSRLLSMLLDNILALLAGLPVEAIVVANIARGWWGHFIHADVPWTLGPLGLAMISPAAHRLHHIRDERLMGANYGNTVTVWDRLFGTWTDPAPYLGCETGIAEGSRGFWGELKRPWEPVYRSRKNGGEAAAPV